MLWKRGYANLRNRIAVDTADTADRLAFEASRRKPEDASPLAKKTLFSFAASVFRAIWAFFGFGKPRKTYTMRPYDPPKRVKVSKGKRGRMHNALHVTPSRGFGSSRSGSKLFKGIKEVRHA
jgi:hypothetical protein